MKFPKEQKENKGLCMAQHDMNAASQQGLASTPVLLQSS